MDALFITFAIALIAGPMFGALLAAILDCRRAARRERTARAPSADLTPAIRAAGRRRGRFRSTLAAHLPHA